MRLLQRRGLLVPGAPDSLARDQPLLATLTTAFYRVGRPLLPSPELRSVNGPDQRRAWPCTRSTLGDSGSDDGAAAAVRPRSPARIPLVADTDQASGHNWQCGRVGLAGRRSAAALVRA